MSSKIGWSSFNPHYSSLLLYQDKYGSTDRPLGTQQSPYMTSSGEKTYGVKDPEYWRRYRERRTLGFPESAVTTPFHSGYKYPGYRYYNYMDYYYPSYGRSLIPRSSYYSSRYPYDYDPYYYSSLRPYSRYGYYSNWRSADYDPDLHLAPATQARGKWSMDFPGYTQHLGATEIVKHVPEGFRLPVDFNARSSSVPPFGNHNMSAIGGSVPVSQVHTLDLEVLPAKIDANLVRPKRLLQSLNIGADDLDWMPAKTTTKRTTKKLAITSSGGGAKEWVRRRGWRFGYGGWLRRWGALDDDLALPYRYFDRYYGYHSPYYLSSRPHHLLPRVLPSSVTTPRKAAAASTAALEAAAASTSTATQPSSAIGRRVAAALSTTDFVKPLPPPFVLEKDQQPRDSERDKAINTAKQLYFNIMGKVVWDGPPGGGGGAAATAVNIEDINAIYGERGGRLDRDGLLDLIKTKGIRIDSVEILKFLRQPTEERLAEAQGVSLKK